MVFAAEQVGSRLRHPPHFRGSAHYWQHDYARGETGGSGSYVALAHANMDLFYAFVRGQGTRSIIDFCPSMCPDPRFPKAARPRAVML
jgi:hypothetical protein